MCRQSDEIESRCVTMNGPYKLDRTSLYKLAKFTEMQHKLVAAGGHAALIYQSAGTMELLGIRLPAVYGASMSQYEGIYESTSRILTHAYRHLRSPHTHTSKISHVERYFLYFLNWISIIVGGNVCPNCHRIFPVNNLISEWFINKLFLWNL